ncbi:hypothetical protein BDW02DRAFT_362237 [Decorospora gaudefroyi]|uniref:3'-5' exonuclease domain-containing protein n=1 Tax=Decorospora gaudefroyi TaxID=184978 RepID=A0A6A5KUI8_9PLEO|nr:hypothetical protein BDW02DRAFT_362237 [Decorospora gaudefroyi]
MLFRRRAPLLSASDAPQRIGAEVPRSLPLAAEHRAQRVVNSLAPGQLLASRAMQPTPPRPTPPTSPSVTYRWQQGPPGTANTSSDRQVHQLPSSRTQASPDRPHSTATMPLIGNAGRTRCAPAAQHRIGLWNPSMALRFAPSVSGEAQHSMATSAGSNTASQHEIDTPATSHIHATSLDMPWTAAERDNGLSDSGETSAETKANIQSHMPYRGKPSSNMRTRLDSDISREQGPDTQPVGLNDVESSVALTYQIPEDKLRAAMLASPNTRASFWCAKLYQGPDGEPLSTHYCRTLEVAERVAQYFLKEKVVGFDIEWKPWGSPTSIKQNASLIQLACENRIALFHISLFTGTRVEQLMPPSLKAVLESPDICKVGVAIKGDFKRLEKYLDIQAQGVFELSRLYNLVEWYEVDPSKVSNRLVRLAAQVLQHLQLPLYKGERLEDAPDQTSNVRESDWSLPLDLEQIHYAAADAYAGFRLYHILEWKRTRLRPTPPAILLCDYDSRPAPRSKEPRKKGRAVTTSKRVGDTDMKLPVDPTEGYQEGAKDADGYETAPEELVDSHQLEDPVPATSPLAPGDTEDAALGTPGVTETEPESEKYKDQTSEAFPQHNRVGRVNLSREKDTDPGYPTLPAGSQQPVKLPSSTKSLIKSSELAVGGADDRMSSSLQLAEPSSDLDDEFADPQLEEALARINVGGTGKPREEARHSGLDIGAQEAYSSPSVTGAHDAHELELSSSLNVESTAVRESDNIGVHDPSHRAPISLESRERDELMATSKESLHTPGYDSATLWAREHVQSTIPSPNSTAPSRIHATMAHLRAYHLWHHQKLSIDEISQVLRDPPLSYSTVLNYVLQAITLERLEYEEESLRGVMLAMPSGMRKGRWKGLAEKVGALD